MTRSSQRIIGALLIIAGAGLASVISLLPEIDPLKTSDPAILMQQAVIIEDTSMPPDAPAHLPVLVSGEANIGHTATDLMTVQQGNHLAIKRRMETFAWVETPVPETELPKGKLSLTDKYRYHTEWLREPTPWRQFKVWKGHKYVQPSILDEDIVASGVTIGRLIVSMDDATFLQWEHYLPGKETLPFIRDLNTDEKYFYEKEIDPENPSPGDYRIKIDVVPYKTKAPLVTVLGARDFNYLVPFTPPNGKSFLYVFIGTPDELLEKLAPPALSVSTIKMFRLVLPGLGTLVVLAGLLLLALGFQKKDETT